MAYAEKRGDYWRGRYKNAPGVLPAWGTISEDPLTGLPFTEKQRARDCANDKESEIRNATVVARDPRLREVDLETWVAEKWLPAQDLEDKTLADYGDLLKNHIYPAFGDRQLRSLVDPQEVAAWEIKIRSTPRIRGTGTYSLRTSKHSRRLLSVILDDARQAGLVDINAAFQARRRGKKRSRVTRRTTRQAEKVWTSPFEVLRMAERCAILSGRDDEFILAVLIGWTGLRWGEALGLEVPDVDIAGKIDLKWQLQELNGRFTKITPKDGSARKLDKPPFLKELLELQANQTPGRCSCPDKRCGGAGQYLFLTPGSRKGPSHIDHSTFSEKIWRPAADGVYPAVEGKAPRPARPVLVDGVTGLPLKPAWPFAQPGQDWSAPRGRGHTQHDQPIVRAHAIACPSCSASSGEACRTETGHVAADHRARVAAAQEAGLVSERGLASWRPLKPGLVAHGLRHGHQTWMVEAGLPKVMSADRLGHTLPGIQDLYTHVSAQMRADLLELLERLWGEALDARIGMDVAAGRRPGSPVAVLDRILRARWETKRRSSPVCLPIVQCPLREASSAGAGVGG